MVQYDRFYFNMKQWHHYSANELATQYSNTWLVLAVAVKEHFRNPPPSPALLAYICYRVIYCVLYMENMKIVSPSFFLSDKLKEPIHIKFWSDRTSTKYLQAEKYLVLKKTCRPLSLDRIQSMSKCKATLGSVRGRPHQRVKTLSLYPLPGLTNPRRVRCVKWHFFLMTCLLYPTSPLRCCRLPSMFRPGGRDELEGRTSLSVWLQRPHLMRVLQLNEHLLWLPQSRINPISQCL